MSDVNDLLKLAGVYENRCVQDLVKIAKIRKLPNGRYRVLSQDGKNLGTCKSLKAAKKRLKQVEYFKHFDHSNAEDTSSIIDLTDIDEFAYSAVMRKLRQHAKPEQILQFLKLYKLEFDRAVKGKIHKPEKVALQNSMVKFNKLHKVKLDKKMVKLRRTFRPRSSPPRRRAPPRRRRCRRCDRSKGLADQSIGAAPSSRN